MAYNVAPRHISCLSRGSLWGWQLSFISDTRQKKKMRERQQKWLSWSNMNLSSIIITDDHWFERHNRLIWFLHQTIFYGIVNFPIGFVTPHVIYMITHGTYSFWGLWLLANCQCKLTKTNTRVGINRSVMASPLRKSWYHSHSCSMPLNSTFKYLYYIK